MTAASAAAIITAPPSPGLYAIGDISTELHQISVACGHAAIAATDIHNHPARNFK